MLLLLLPSFLLCTDSTMSIKSIMEMMIACRGDNVMTVSSFANGLSYVAREIYSLKDKGKTEATITQIVVLPVIS